MSDMFGKVFAANLFLLKKNLEILENAGKKVKAIDRTFSLNPLYAQYKQSKIIKEARQSAAAKALLIDKPRRVRNRNKKVNEERNRDIFTHKTSMATDSIDMPQEKLSMTHHKSVARKKKKKDNMQHMGFNPRPIKQTNKTF